MSQQTWVGSDQAKDVLLNRVQDNDQDLQTQINALTGANGSLITSNDTTAGFLNTKLTVSDVITKTVVDPGANETLDLTVPDDAVTYAKIQNVVSDDVVLGRVSGANGVIEELTQAQALDLIAPNDSITYAKIQNIVSDDVLLGRISGANGLIEEVTASQIRTLINVEDGAGFGSGVSMVFNQATAPVGWTKKTDWAANASIIVGNTYGDGGSDSPISWETAIAADDHAEHNHQWYNFASGAGDQSYGSGGAGLTIQSTLLSTYGLHTGSASAQKITTDYWTDNESAMEHTITQDTYAPIYQIMISATKD